MSVLVGALLIVALICFLLAISDLIANRKVELIALGLALWLLTILIPFFGGK